MSSEPFIKLSDYDGNRKNNFTSLRIFFAWCVLFSHSYPIQQADSINPLVYVFKGSTEIGTLAVYSFFSISGFLVSGSFVKRGFKEYIISRFLRIFPGLFVCVTITAIAFGLIMTKLTSYEYILRGETYKYIRNAFPYNFNMSRHLPGVFHDNINRSVNGSLWTLPIEVRCYTALAIIGVFGCFKNRLFANITMLSIFILGCFYSVNFSFFGGFHSIQPALYFLIGMFVYFNRSYIYFDYRITLLAAILMFSSFGTWWNIYIFPPALVYLIFYLSYSTKYINADGGIGDISYGIYIYSWPIQQIIADYFPNISPLGNVMYSSIVTFLFALVSWRYIESPMLKLKNKLI